MGTFLDCQGEREEDCFFGMPVGEGGPAWHHFRNSSNQGPENKACMGVTDLLTRGNCEFTARSSSTLFSGAIDARSLGVLQSAVRPDFMSYRPPARNPASRGRAAVRAQRRPGKMLK